MLSWSHYRKKLHRCMNTYNHFSFAIMINTHSLSSHSKQPRLVFGIIIVLLWWLLYSKLSGHQEIFSYRSIDTLPGYASYQSTIKAINKVLVWWTWSSTSALQKGVEQLQDTIKKVRNRSLYSLSSGSLIQAQALLMLSKTNDCYDLLIDGYHHTQSIHTGYNLLTSGYVTMKYSLQSVLWVLPSSATKECLQGYTNSLSDIYDSLVLTNRTINTLDSSYSTILYTYKGVQGDCGWLKKLVDSLSGLQYRIESINQIIFAVQKSLDSRQIAKYNDFCKYQGIVWLSWLQKLSWDTLTQSTSLWWSLSKVKDLKWYIQQLIDTSTTSWWNMNNSWSSIRRWK